MSRPCPACKGPGSKFAGKKLEYELVRCTDCRTLFTKEKPAVGDEQNYEDYGPGESQVPDFIDKRCDELVQPFDAYRKLNRFLEVGFGAGTIIRAAARAGWRATGVEMSKEAVRSLSERHPDLELFSGTVEGQSFQEGSFDAVAIVEVIEHVVDPTPMLDEAFRVLRPGGVAWVTTPNLRSISSKLLGLDWSMVAPPDHLAIYSLRGVRELMRRSGFKKIKIYTYGLNPHEIVTHYRRGKEATGEFDRLHAGYELNESLEAGNLGKLIKRAANAALNATKLGDSIKIWAEKP